MTVETNVEETKENPLANSKGSVLGSENEGEAIFGQKFSEEDDIPEESKKEPKQPSLADTNKENTEVVESKKWHENTTEEDFKKYKDAFENYTKKAQALAEERRQLETQKKEKPEPKKEEISDFDISKFEELDFDEQPLELAKRYSNIKKELDELKKMANVLPELQQILGEFKLDKVVKTIQSKVKELDGLEIKREQIGEIAQKAVELGIACDTPDQFLFAYNAFKGSVGKDWAKQIEKEVREKTFKDIENKKTSLSVLENNGVSTDNGNNTAPMTEGVRRRAMLADAKKILRG